MKHVSVCSPWCRYRGRIQSHSLQPASLTQKGIMFLASRTARHIENNILLEAQGTSVGPIFFHCRSVAGAFAGAGSHLCAAHALWLCLFPLHDSMGPDGASSEAQRRGALRIRSTTVSACQDVLNIKTGKYYPGVLLFERPLSECF